MTAQELQEVQHKLGLTDQEMAAQLNTPLPTYRKWKQGQRRVPGVVEVAVFALPRDINKERHGEYKAAAASQKNV